MILLIIIVNVDILVRKRVLLFVIVVEPAVPGLILKGNRETFRVIFAKLVKSR